VVVLFEEIDWADKREAYGAYILYSQTLYSSLIAFYRCLFFLSLQMSTGLLILIARELSRTNAVVLVPTCVVSRPSP